MIHIAEVTQLRHDPVGRAYYQRKRDEGKKPMEAMRCLKRRLSDVIYRRLVADDDLATINKRVDPVGADPGGHCGASQESSAVDLPPRTSTLDQPLPGPAVMTLRLAPPARKINTDTTLEPAG